MKLKLVPALALAAACLSTHATDATANATNTFAVTGMHCDGCAKGITSELKRTPGVITATVLVVLGSGGLYLLFKRKDWL